jgi:pyruvate formate lyase activating enzyme
MEIHGIQKMTLLDYPEKVACTIFTARCNFRCPFCHNASLVTHVDAAAAISEEEVFSFLAKRQGILDGVCITGGEPLLQPDIEEFIRKVKELGYQVKHTPSRIPCRFARNENTSSSEIAAAASTCVTREAL